MEQLGGQLVECFRKAKNIVFLTGAGMSTESGIPDFRSPGGLYTGEMAVEEVISATYFKKDPVQFWEKFSQIFALKLLGGYEPNAGHRFLAELERKGEGVTILTQNIDGLHQEAGSRNVIEIHGSLRVCRCTSCRKEYPIAEFLSGDTPVCPGCQNYLKPDVVLYEEEVRRYEEALHAAYDADLFVVMGTSLEVYPVNSIPRIVARTDIPMVLINREETGMDGLFTFRVQGQIGEILTRISKQL